MRILFAGTPDTAVTVLGGLRNSGHEIVAVLTREDAPVGRSKTLTPSPVASYATEKGIPVIKANRITDAVRDEIKATRADLAIVVAYGSILSKESLDVLPAGWFNIHYSLLPKYRGAAPVQHALLKGETETGITLFKIDEGLDTGPIVGNVATQIHPGETAGELLQRLSHLAVTLLNEKLPSIYSGNPQLVQQSTEATVAPKFSRKDARLSLSMTAIEAENLVRAMNPEPMAWLEYEGESFRILEAKALSGTSASQPGTVELEPPALVLKNGERLLLQTVQPAGKKPMNAADWARGLKQSGRFQ